ncbi:hypothetical protein FB451DRAFT_1553812 [Mycena latifolia]|nr:hypothetical protein FB451DRAFT_1553812 [Mycena latifolia]
MSEIIGLPLDIIIEVVYCLDLLDSIHLLSTCSAFRALVFSRNFWIKALYRVKYVCKQPLPCSADVDISTLPLATLREMAERAYKLDKRWSRESISPLSIRTIAVGKDILKICTIPGTDLILITTWANNRLSCLDTCSGEFVASLDFKDATSITIGPCPFELPGQCLIAFACRHPRDNSVELASLRLDFRNRAHITMNKEYSKVWNSPNSNLWYIAINDHMLAGILESPTGTDATLVYYWFHENILHSIPLGTHPPQSCVLHRGSLYMARHDFTGPAEILRFRSESSPPRLVMLETVEADTSREDSAWKPAVFLGDCNTRVPAYGVLNVTTRSAVEEDTERDYVHFWPFDDDAHAHLALGPPVPYRHSCMIHSMSVGSAGTSVVIWDVQDAAHLVRYHAHPTPHTTVHRLDLSGANLDTRRVPILKLDDRLGVLYVRDRDETCEVLSVLSYA